MSDDILYSPVRLIGTAAEGFAHLTERCEYPKDDSTRQLGMDLIGYWVDDYDDDIQTSPEGKLYQLSNGAPCKGIVIVHDRFMPIDVDVFLDEAGATWGVDGQFS